MNKNIRPQNEILGQVLLNSGLPGILGINCNKKSLKNDKEGIIILTGLLAEIANGNIGDPKDLPEWKKTGELLFEKERKEK